MAILEKAAARRAARSSQGGEIDNLPSNYHSEVYKERKKLRDEKLQRAQGADAEDQPKMTKIRHSGADRGMTKTQKLAAAVDQLKQALFRITTDISEHMEELKEAIDNTKMLQEEYKTS